VIAGGYKGESHEGMQKQIRKHLAGGTNLSADRVRWIADVCQRGGRAGAGERSSRLDSGFDERRRNLRD
jgi:hypothetical protein